MRKVYTDKIVITIAIILLIIGFIIIILFSVVEPFNDWSGIPSPELFAQYGSFIGGFIGTIFSLVAALLIYRTLVAQKDAIRKQEDLFKLGSFETTFFNLLKTQQEITTEIQASFSYLNNSFNEKSYSAKGRGFFAFAKNELERIFKSIENDTYLGSFSFDDIDSLEQEILAIEVLGTTDGTPSFLIEDEKKLIYNREKIRYVNKIYGIDEKKWEELNKLPVHEKIKVAYNLFFKKHHPHIGHYFRHLYHLIKFSIELRPITEDSKNKYNFTNFIQAQMSSYELMLLFYNAMSFPKMQLRIIETNFLENLAEEDLVTLSHNCIDGIKLKKRRDLLGTMK